MQELIRLKPVEGEQYPTTSRQSKTQHQHPASSSHPIPPEVAAFYIRLPLGRRGVGDKVRALSFVYELVILAVPNLNDVVEVLARRWELK